MNYRYLFALIIFVISQNIFAQSAGYKFNDSGTVKPESDKVFKFQLPTEASRTGDDQVKESQARSNSLYMAPVGYPKKEFILSYNPGYNGFKNVLSSSRTYSYGGLTSVAFSGSMKFSSTFSDYFLLDLNIMRVSVPAYNDSVAGFTVVGSSTYLYTMSFAGNISCSIGDTAFNQFCYGYQFNLDSFPSLTFPQTSNTEIQMTAVKDMTLGLYLEYMRPLFGNSILKSKAGLDYGFGVGQASDLFTKSNQRLYGSVGAEWPAFSGNASITGGGEYRLAAMATALDDWKIQNLSYYAKLGYRWEWGKD